MHSGELGAVEVGGDDDSGRDDDARSRNSAGSKGSSGNGVEWRHKAQRTGPPLPSVPAVPPTAEVVDWLQQQQVPPKWH